MSEESPTPSEILPRGETRIVFMGTPGFAVPSLCKLIEQEEARGWKVVAVYTQPDRRAGRGKKILTSPIKDLALENEIPVVQPDRLKNNPDAIAELENFAPDLVVVAAYGMILPSQALAIPTFGCINVHASLLPAYRGASPINAAMLDGLDETGNSIMIMDEGLDTGPVLAQDTTPIYANDTAVDVTERLAQSGAELLIQTLPPWLSGEIAPIPQDELAGEPSICRIIKKSAGQIDWTLPAEKIERMTRAYHPWPSAFTFWKDNPLKILAASVAEGHAEAGAVVDTPGGVAVGCGEGLLLLKEVQPAGKRAMNTKSFLNGSPEFLQATLR